MDQKHANPSLDRRKADAQSAALIVNAIPAGLLRGVPRVRSATLKTAEVRVASGVPFSSQDFFFVQYGSDPDNLTEKSAQVQLPTAAGRGAMAAMTNLAIGKRYYYRISVSYQSQTYNDQNVHSFQHRAQPGDYFAFLFHGDLHALRLYRQATGEEPVSGLPKFSCPQTYRLQLFQQAVGAMLAERGENNEPMLFQIDAGDGWAQGKLNAAVTPFPLNPDGSSQPGANKSYVTDPDQAGIVLNLTSGDDASLADIPVEIELPSNHYGSHSFMYGAGSGVQGSNTLKPVVDVPNWLMNAQDEFMGRPRATDLYLPGSDPHGRWGAFDCGSARFAWIDVYLYSRLSTTNPNSLPITFDSVDDWTIGPQYDWLFNKSNGMLTTCTQPHFLLFAHNWTGGAAMGGPGNYGWGGIKVASPHGEVPTGEWPGTKAWQKADRYGYGAHPAGSWQHDLYTFGVHRSIVRRKPAGTQVYLFDGHAHFFCIESGGDGINYHQTGRIVGDSDDSVAAGPGSRGHRVGPAGNPRGYSDTLRPGDFWANNGGYFRIDVSLKTLRVQIRKVWSDFQGQETAAGSPVNPIAFNPGFVMNLGPNAIQQPFETVFDRTYYHPDAPAPAFNDTFIRFVEDSTVMAPAGQAQPQVLQGEAAQCTTESGAFWNNYTLAADQKSFLAVRNSVIDGKRALTSRRPYSQTAPAVWEGIRRKISSVARTIRVHVRMQKATEEAGVIQLGGKPVIPFVNQGFGLYLAYKAGEITRFGIELPGQNTILAGPTVSTALNDADFARFEFQIASGQVIVKLEDVQLFKATLSAQQWTWFNNINNSSWVGLATKISNRPEEGQVFEFRSFSATSGGIA